MRFDGRFADSLVAGNLDRVSLSFLVEDLQVRRGGTAGNIAFGLAVLGLRPVLVASVGADFADYRSWLERHGVDCSEVRVSDTRHTARFVCTTDNDQAQIATFYSGAMAEARDIELGPIRERVGGLDLVVVSPNDPVAMHRHSEECRERGLPFVADPSQQLAWMDGAAIRRLLDGARYLFCNEYEAALLEQKTGWTSSQVLSQVGVRVTTLGREGSRVETAGEPSLTVGIPARVEAVDPTGVGDAFRAGFLAGVAWGLEHERCAQLGSLLAGYVVSTVGTQEYEFESTAFLARLAAGYDDAAAEDVAPHLLGSLV